MRISILTPSLNSADSIATAIDSVANQGHLDVEHVVADAASSDGTIAILKSRPHVRWISEPDQGQSDAINKAFAMSTGDIIGNLNADDYYLPGAFKTVLEAFQDPTVLVVVGRVRIEPWHSAPWINDPSVELKEMLQWWNRDAYCRNPVGFFYRRSIHEGLGGFDITNHNTMDLDFLLRARRITDFKKIPDILGVFRLTEDTKTAQSQGFRDVERKFGICERHLPTGDPAFAQYYRRMHAAALMKRREKAWRQDVLRLMTRSHHTGIEQWASVFLEVPALLRNRLAHITAQLPRPTAPPSES
jgi:hypothetical protein